MTTVDLAQIIAAAAAPVGLFLLWWQVRKQTAQHFSDRVLDLYRELDTTAAREERRFVYTEFPRLGKPTEKEEQRVREVLAAMDRMAYQVVRGYADPIAAHDLYGRVLTRTVFSTWEWLQEERRRRNEPPEFHYCRHAERLALIFARDDLKAIGRWKRSYRTLPPRELLRKAVEWLPPPMLAALDKPKCDLGTPGPAG